MEPIENHLIQHEEHSSINSNEKNLGIWSLAVTVSLLSLLWSFFFGEGKKETIPQKRKKIFVICYNTESSGFLLYSKNARITYPSHGTTNCFCFVLFLFLSTVTSPLCALAGSESQNNRFETNTFFSQLN